LRGAVEKGVVHIRKVRRVHAHKRFSGEGEAGKSVAGVAQVVFGRVLPLPVSFVVGSQALQPDPNVQASPKIQLICSWNQINAI